MATSQTSDAVEAAHEVIEDRAGKAAKRWKPRATRGAI